MFMRAAYQAVTVFFAVLTPLSAAELKPETVQAWDAYIRSINARAPGNGQHFLRIDQSSDGTERVRKGEIVVAPVGDNPKHVPGGLIHDWVGTSFIPNAAIEDVLSTVNDYDRYENFYAPHVVDAKLMSRNSDEFRFRMLLMHKAMFASSALEGDYEAKYVEVDPHRWYSVAYTTRLQQIDGYGTAEAHKLPPDHGSGYIWRLYSIARFEQRDGGVYVELEAIALSRDIPASLHWIVEPMVRRLSKSSVITSLEQTRTAVRGSALMTRRERRQNDAAAWSKTNARESGALTTAP